VGIPPGLPPHTLMSIRSSRSSPTTTRRVMPHFSHWLTRAESSRRTAAVPARGPLPVLPIKGEGSKEEPQSL
jgi:hypothetical protein